MKKLSVLLAVFLLTLAPSNAIEEQNTDENTYQYDSAESVIQSNQLYEAPVILDKPDEHINIESENSPLKLTEDTYKLKIECNKIPSSLLEKYTTWNIEKGPVEKLHFWSGYKTNADFNFYQDGHNTTRFYQGLINVFLDGEFRGGQEEFRIMLDPTPQSERPYLQPFVQDLYIQTKRIPHHKILIGNSRAGVGIEGAQSSYTLPFLNRAQISRNYGTARKFGLRVRGDYKLVNYDIGGYSSDTYFSSFFPGAEFDGWVNFKPLGKTDGKYGTLIAGGGIVSGKRHDVDFFVTGANLSYEYKKFWARAEYEAANGSNGYTGLTKNKSHGWYAAAGYYITPKLEIVARYDEFDPNRHIRHNNQREYSAGLNYYIKGQALRLTINYVYCQYDNKTDAHRLLLGTQIAL